MRADLSLRLAAGPDSPSTARRALGALEAHLSDDELDDLRLMVSELLTNTIRHADVGDDQLGIEVTLGDDRMRVVVSDSGPGFDPAEHRADAHQFSGWGLQLVDRIADRWGVERGLETRVWFEVDRDPNAAALC